MKTALIAGVCLLALTLTITDALDKKQDVCGNPNDDVQACEAATNAIPIDKDTLCTDRCKSALTEYLEDCYGDEAVDEFNKQFDQQCSAAGTVVTLFTLVSAVLVAVGN